MYNELMKDLSTAKYVQKYVAFVDVLGYSNVLLNSEDPFEISVQQGIMDIFKNYAKEESDIDVVSFSDSMYIASDHIEKIIKFISALQIKLLQSFEHTYNITNRDELNNEPDFSLNARLLRGGIEYGKVFLRSYDKNTIITGPAVVQAYKLESAVAIFPRIVFGDKALLKLRESSDEEWIQVSEDGIAYLDFINYYFKNVIVIKPDEKKEFLHSMQNVKETIEKNSSHYRTDLHIKQKYDWFLNYLEKLDIE